MMGRMDTPAVSPAVPLVAHWAPRARRWAPGLALATAAILLLTMVADVLMSPVYLFVAHGDLAAFSAAWMMLLTVLGWVLTVASCALAVALMVAWTAYGADRRWLAVTALGLALCWARRVLHSAVNQWLFGGMTDVTPVLVGQVAVVSMLIELVAVGLLVLGAVRLRRSEQLL